METRSRDEREADAANGEKELASWFRIIFYGRQSVIPRPDDHCLVGNVILEGAHETFLRTTTTPPHIPPASAHGHEERSGGGLSYITPRSHLFAGNPACFISTTARRAARSALEGAHDDSKQAKPTPRFLDERAGRKERFKYQ
jgi:hypothetical protein